MIRARNDSQKRLRRAALVAAARAGLAGAAYEQLHMAAIAKAAGVAKGSAYLYFETKESLFLALVQEELDQWFDAVDAALPKAAGPVAVAEVFVRTLMPRPLLRRLLAVLHVLLEQNVPSDDVRQFKTFLLRRIDHAAQLLAGALPPLTAEAAAQLLLQLDALLIGIQHLSDPAPAVALVLQQPNMAALRVDTETYLRQGIGWLLAGALLHATPSQPNP